MNNPLNKILRPLGLELRRRKRRPYRETVSLKTDKISKGTILLAYIVDPFLLPDYELPSQAHTHHTESLLIAEAFLNSGYDVDVIDYRNKAFRPTKSYQMFFSARTHFVAISKRLNAECIKIAHLDTAHFLFNNAAAYQRLLNLQQRRGVTTSSMKTIEHSYAVEEADYLTMLGNEFTESTYRYAGKKIFQLPVPTPNLYEPAYDKDFANIKNRFLWMGSEGMVHKGLDLVLDVFRELPDCHLTVCGPVDIPWESNFRQAYHKELYETDNIETIGWIDVSSQKFIDITRNSVAMVYPSASEGQAGAVITCLQRSLIPIISYESGVSVENFGIVLKQCTHEEIKTSVLKISTLSDNELSHMAQASYNYAQKNHSKETYVRQLMKTITEIEKSNTKLLNA